MSAKNLLIFQKKIIYLYLETTSRATSMPKLWFLALPIKQ